MRIASIADARAATFSNGFPPDFASRAEGGHCSAACAELIAEYPVKLTLSRTYNLAHTGCQRHSVFHRRRTTSGEDAVLPTSRHL